MPSHRKMRRPIYQPRVQESVYSSSVGIRGRSSPAMAPEAPEAVRLVSRSDRYSFCVFCHRLRIVFVSGEGLRRVRCLQLHFEEGAALTPATTADAENNSCGRTPETRERRRFDYIISSQHSLSSVGNGIRVLIKTLTTRQHKFFFYSEYTTV